jgi:hypothetical protein
LLPVLVRPFDTEMTDSLPMNALQSAEERAPVILAEASARESCCPASESPFAVPRVRASCVAPWRAAICPDIVDAFAERVATDPERDVRFALVIARELLALATAVARFALVVAILPERVV